MKKKILLGFLSIALVAVLGLNINLAHSNHYGNLSLKDLFSAPQASAEINPTALCQQWCYHADYYIFELLAGDETGTYTIYCYHMYRW